MIKIKIFFLLILASVLFYPAYSFAGQADVKGGYEATGHKLTDSNSNSPDFCWDTWNFEESAPDSLTSYVKATSGIVYGWKVTTLAAGTHAIAYLYDGNYSSGNVGMIDELYVNSTHFDNHYSWPFGAVFSTEISVTRSSITDINVFVYYR